MSKDTGKKTSKVEERTERARPVRITRDMLENHGPLVVPSRFKKEGMSYLYINKLPKDVDAKLNLGYVIAKDSDGNSHEVETHPHKQVLMEIPQKYADQIKAIKSEIRADKTAERLEIKNPEGSTKPYGSDGTGGVYEKELKQTKI